MKTLKCDLCEYEARGETFEEWMKALHPHYMEAHADVMSDSSKTKDDMEKWMAENKARFDVA
jgi:predicted small metal-binding protein